MSKVEQLAAKLKKLSPGNQLRVAAALMDEHDYETAMAILGYVSDQYMLAKLLAKK
jgi:hypothetical protein